MKARLRIATFVSLAFWWLGSRTFNLVYGDEELEVGGAGPSEA